MCWGKKDANESTKILLHSKFKWNAKQHRTQILWGKLTHFLYAYKLIYYKIIIK